MNALFIFKHVALETGSVAIADEISTYCENNSIDFNCESDILTRFYIARDEEDFEDLADFIIDHSDNCNQNALDNGRLEVTFDAIKDFLEDNNIAFLETENDIIADLNTMNN